MLSEYEYRRLLEDANGIPRRDYATTYVALLFAIITFFFTIFFAINTGNFLVGIVISLFGLFVAVQFINISGGAMMTRTQAARQELTRYYESLGYTSIADTDHHMLYSGLINTTKRTNNLR